MATFFVSAGQFVQAWSPFQGTHPGGHNAAHPNRTAWIQSALEDVAKKYGTSVDAIGLAWILRHPANLVPIVGSRRPERLKRYADALELVLERPDWYRLLYPAYSQTDLAVHEG